MKIVSGFIVRQIAGETVAIPSGSSAHRLSGLIALNDSGKFLFELMQTEQTEDSLIQALLENFEVDPDTAKQDVTDFIAMLQEYDLLVK
jgi:hypothetical protein